ncbi:MAG: hypothetical protein ABEI39_06270 [Halobacteriales archaeon]
MADSEDVPFWWIALFLLLALGAGAVAVVTAGGSLIAGGAVVLPLSV